jgi:hypothetical protein
MKGVGPVKDIEEIGIESGLSKDWYSKDHKHKKNRNEIKKGDFWDIIDNPLYQVAAEAQGYDWDDWVKEAEGLVGTGPDDGTVRVRATIRAGTPGGPRRGHRKKEGGWTTVNSPGTPAEYEWMTRDEAEEGGYDYDLPKTTRWKNKETGEIVVGTRGGTGDGDSRFTVMGVPIDGGGGAGGILSLFGGGDDDEDDNWEELRDWGVHDEGVAADLDEIQSFLGDIVDVNDHLSEIIREGPQAEWYGLPPGTDVWEHYGLDEEPQPPEELDWDSYEKSDDFVLKETIKSTVTYSTPQGITPVDLHGEETVTETVQPGEVTEGESTSSGEQESKLSSRSRWRKNVNDIIGEGQDWKDWARLAGVNNLNSRNDSDKIKTVFREHDGVLPT